MCAFRENNSEIIHDSIYARQRSGSLAVPAVQSSSKWRKISQLCKDKIASYARTIINTESTQKHPAKS